VGAVVAGFYYQHVGEEMAARDFPRTIGTPLDGTVEFEVSYVASWECLAPENAAYLRDNERRGQLGGFQFWGFPRGAERALAKMGDGDELMLMSSKLFEIVATVVGRLPRFDDALSTRLWGEAKFPIVVAIQNVDFVELPFEVFRERLRFAPNYHMRGKTMRVGDSKLREAGFANARDLSRWCRSYSVERQERSDWE
jgi:hypothetical protein